MDILFTTSNHLSSKLIREVTGESVSHVALCAGDYVVHSTGSGGGVKITSFDKFSWENQIVYLVSRPDLGGEKELLKFYVSVADKRYDWTCLLSLGMLYLLKLALSPFKVKFRPDRMSVIQVSGMYDCVELVTKYAWGREFSNLTPLNLHKMLIK